MTLTKQETIKKEMSFGEVLQKSPEAAEILFENGLHCIGCGMAMYESLEDGCKSHGMNKKQIDELIKKLNKKEKTKK
jgi:hybrid cluster-associated redox disulfide protein